MSDVLRMKAPRDVYDHAENAALRITRLRLRQPVLDAVRELAAEIAPALEKAGHEKHGNLLVEVAAGEMEQALMDIIWHEMWSALEVRP